MPEYEVMLELEEHFEVRDSICAFIGKQRAPHAEKVEALVEELARKRPWAKIVGSETSDAEAASLRAAAMTGLRSTVITSPRKERGCRENWDAGPDIRDERIVSEATDIFLMDDSTRCKGIEKLAKRMVTKRVWRMYAQQQA